MKRYGTVVLALAAIATLCAARLSPATASAFDVIETPHDASPSRQRVAQFVLMTKRAAENDNCDAMNTLGVLYASGDAIEQDYTAALYWFLEAIDRGSVDAILAYAWTATALLSGQPAKDEQALHKLAHLRFALSGEKLSRAQLLSVHLSTLVELRAANSATDAESAVFSGRR